MAFFGMAPFCGEAGFRYLVEKSVRTMDSNWPPYAVLTNVTGSVTFSDSASGGSSIVLFTGESSINSRPADGCRTDKAAGRHIEKTVVKLTRLTKKQAYSGALTAAPSLASADAVDLPVRFWLADGAFRTHPGPRKRLSLPVIVGDTVTLMLPARGPQAIAERLYVKVAAFPAQS
jgi:hypothetical protein